LLAIPAGRRPVYSQDEARQLLLARDVLDRGHWLVAEVRGRLYLNKPQLYFWTIAAASAPFGAVSEWSASIPSLVASVVTVAAVMAAARAAWTSTVAALAGLILITTPLHFELGHFMLPDAMLTAWLTLALAAYLGAAHRRWPLGRVMLFYVAVAGGLLTKGPVALLAVLAALLATACTDGRAGLSALRLGRGLGMLLIAAVPWLVPYYARGRAAFAQGTTYDQYVRWVLVDTEAGASGGVVDRLSHLVSALANFFPWTLALLASAVLWRLTSDRAQRRLVVWTLTLWITIALSGTFRTRYLLPLYPCFSLLVAHVVTTADGGRRRIARAVLAVTTLAMVAALIALVALGHLMRGEDRVFVPDATWERAVVAIAAVLGGGAALLLLARRALVPATAALAVTMAGVMAVEGVAFPVRYARMYDLRPIAAAVAREAAGGAAIVGHPDLRLSYDVYVGRAGEEAPSPEALRARLRDPAPAVIVTPAARWHAVAPDARAGWQVVHEGTVADRATVVVTRASR
jgi:4-amino-4-deoxy-L-arabinose transferase-like glycosyltransferase